MATSAGRCTKGTPPRAQPRHSSAAAIGTHSKGTTYLWGAAGFERGDVGKRDVLQQVGFGSDESSWARPDW
jgi:hypothetical protein